jgi:hypothetical protein
LYPLPNEVLGILNATTFSFLKYVISISILFLFQLLF